MLKIALVFFATYLVCVNSLKISPSNCGERPFESNNRIVNGTESIEGDWAWSVSLNTRGLFGSHFCGGVLIRKQWVLCAAHCFRSGNTSITIKVTHNRATGHSWSKSVDSETIFTHEKYSSSKLTDDIAIIRLKEPFEYDNNYVIPACIAETPDDFKDGENDFEDMLAGEKGHLTGWGHTKYQGSTTIVKNEVTLEANTAKFCEEEYAGLYVKQVQICAGNTQSLQGACQGDSGGPYVFKSPKNGKWYNFGLTSWGYSCGIGTVFTRVSNYIDWIKSKMELYPDEDDE